MNVTGTVDSSLAQSALEGLHDAMIGKGRIADAQNLLKDEVRFVSKTIVNFTPPLRGNAGSPRQAGELAIEKELKNLISEATPKLIDEVGSAHGLKDITTAWVTEGDKSHLNLQWANLDPTGNRLAELHQQYRVHGKVPLERRESKGVWKSRVVVPVGTRDPFIKSEQQKVGRWKATWALIGSKLGDTFPQWISRHFGSVSKYAVADLSHMNDPEKPYVIFGSSAPGNLRIRQRIKDALRLRARALKRKTLLVISDYNKDIAKGIRAQQAAHRHREQSPVVE